MATAAKAIFGAYTESLACEQSAGVRRKFWWKSFSALTHREGNHRGVDLGVERLLRVDDELLVHRDIDAERTDAECGRDSEDDVRRRLADARGCHAAHDTDNHDDEHRHDDVENDKVDRIGNASRPGSHGSSSRSGSSLIFCSRISRS